MTVPPASSKVSLQCGAILFDLDGVLVDSAACIEATWRRWALHHRLDPERVIALAHGRRAIETVKLVAPRLVADMELAALAASESTTVEGIFEIEGARQMLQQLPSGTWGIVTSGIREVAVFRLRHTGLPVPDVLVCADEIQRGKPDPEGYLTAARRLGVLPKACIVVEDAPAGLEAARAAGMRSIAVSGTYSRERLAMADYTIPRLSAMQVSAAKPDALLEIHFAPHGGGPMATAKQKAAARRNIKKAAKAARRKKTIAKLPKKIRTALGKQGAKMAQRKRRTRRAGS